MSGGLKLVLRAQPRPPFLKWYLETLFVTQCYPFSSKRFMQNVSIQIGANYPPCCLYVSILTSWGLLQSENDINCAFISTS